MKNLYHSNATIDTYPLTQNSLHNCPSCRCKSTEPQGKLKHVISQPFLRSHKVQQNLYLSSDLSEPCSTERINIKPYQSTIFSNPNKIAFKYTNGVSSKQTNISFSYTSPPKNRKHHSSESKFNTRKFKQTHFPQISQDQSLDHIPAYQPKESSPYYQTYTKQRTPEKHKVLKMKKKDKSKKLQITVVSKSSNSQKSIPHEQIAIQSPIYNDYSMEGPRNTPINALWNGSQKTQKQLSDQQVRRFTNKDKVAASIQYIKQQSESSKSINKVCSPINGGNKKYPTIESIEVYEALRYEQGPYRAKSKNEQQTSLRYIKQASRQSSSLKQESEDIEFARSISEQLQLNYDYYYPQDESDKSLSIQVTL